jgi:hypothetical protein
MAHCHTNSPAYCTVCDARIYYGDESAPPFCSSACERDWDLNYEYCDKCSESFRRNDMFKTSGDYLFCVGCYEQSLEDE